MAYSKKFGAVRAPIIRSVGKFSSLGEYRLLIVQIATARLGGNPVGYSPVPLTDSFDFMNMSNISGINYDKWDMLQDSTQSINGYSLRLTIFARIVYVFAFIGFFDLNINDIPDRAVVLAMVVETGFNLTAPFRQIERASAVAAAVDITFPQAVLPDGLALAFFVAKIVNSDSLMAFVLPHFNSVTSLTTNASGSSADEVNIFAKVWCSILHAHLRIYMIYSIVYYIILYYIILYYIILYYIISIL